MGPLIVRCPSTGRQITTGLGTDMKSLAPTWDTDIDVPCPHCGKTHRYRVKDAYIAGEISEETLRGDVAKDPRYAQHAKPGF